MIPPGRTIGILGGGQLGRMFAIAARRMGYRVCTLDPIGDCPTGQVADIEINAAYDDLDAAERFARLVDVVTFEFENVPAETLAAIERLRPVRPSPFVLDTCRHRAREKAFLQARGFPVAPHRVVKDVAGAREAAAALGLPVILKTADFGYDGKGQTRIDRPEQVETAWSALGRPVGVVEAVVPFEREVSVIVARDPRGAMADYPAVENAHARHILDVTTAPAPVDADLQAAARGLARDIAASLDLVGVLAVEMFQVGRDLIVNELAPRPHNSGHFSFDACVTSQFEQQLRAVCGLPLGRTDLLRPAAMANLLGDLWEGGEPDWSAALRGGDVKLHLYGKAQPRPGRKMGHLTALADAPEEARRLVVAARDALRRR